MGKKKGRKKSSRRAPSRRKPDTSRDRRFVDIAVIGMLLLAAYFAVFGGEYSIFDIWRLEKTETRAAADLAVAEAAIDSLQTLASEIEYNPEAIERVAREKYGMIKDGEILYRFRDASPDSAAADSIAEPPPGGAG
ncbi:MAG TPA: septum formation initiator family protein [Gemmatimonadota bacterium]|nr:septum formation initiator family protein [Gemmatimonadota bacterium]